jgi:hypothetical protein
MSRPAEQLIATQELTQAAPGYRVLADAEGWPYSPGKHGQLEHLGRGQLAAYTESANLHKRALAIPGVTRHQVGEGEFRVLVSPAACLPLARLLRCHRKRVGGAEHLAKHAYAVAKSPQKAPISVGVAR